MERIVPKAILFPETMTHVACLVEPLQRSLSQTTQCKWILWFAELHEAVCFLNTSHPFYITKEVSPGSRDMATVRFNMLSKTCKGGRTLLREEKKKFFSGRTVK